MSKHTPGPWDTGAGDMTVRLNRLADEIANRFGDHSDRQVEGNAALLLAAPELLAALKLCKQALKNYIDSGYDEDEDQEAYAAAMAAINKAKGGNA